MEDSNYMIMKDKYHKKDYKKFIKIQIKYLIVRVISKNDGQRYHWISMACPKVIKAIYNCKLFTFYLLELT